MKVVKAVQFGIEPDSRLIDLLATFREMVNEAIRVGIETGARSLYRLRNAVYYDFKAKYGLHSHYAYSACEVAYNILRKHRKWGRRPVAKHLMMKLDSESYWVNHLLLRIPTKPGEYLFIQLHGGDYQLSQLDDPSVKRGSVTITPEKVAVTVTRQVEATTTGGAVAYDINLKNVTGVSSKATVPMRYDTSELPRIRAQYREVVSHFRRDDDRVSKRIRSKYGAKEKFKTRALLHKISKDIVSHARENKLTIVLERLKYLRTKHTRQRFESKRTREGLNKWPYRILQHMIEYKARWAEVPLAYVNPANSSKRCCVCGEINSGLTTERAWKCPKCGATLDRDVNAPINLLTTFLKGHETLRFGADWLADEAMKRKVVAMTSAESMSASRREVGRIVAQLGRQNRGLAWREQVQ